METIQEHKPDAVTLMLAELLKPTIREAVAEALANLMEQSHPLPPKPLSVTEAADFLQISIHTIYRLTCQEKIPHYKRGTKLYFDATDLSEWLKEKKRGA